MNHLLRIKYVFLTDLFTDFFNKASVTVVAFFGKQVDSPTFLHLIRRCLSVIDVSNNKFGSSFLFDHLLCVASSSFSLLQILARVEGKLVLPFAEGTVTLLLHRNTKVNSPYRLSSSSSHPLWICYCLDLEIGKLMNRFSASL